MGEDKNLISLRDAAEISGYSSDYIGQLIRQGKIPGKQVYTNIAWMTTAEAVMNYKNKAKNTEEKTGLKESFLAKFRLFSMQINVLKLVFTSFKPALPLLIAIISSFLLLCFYIFYIVVTPEKQVILDNNEVETEEMRF